MPSASLTCFRLLFLAGLMLVGSCSGDADQTNGTGVAALPRTMMNALHNMAQRSRTLPPTGNLDRYFALLLRENHRAAVAMSALELNQGQDPSLRRMAEEMNHAHQQRILGLDSALHRLRARPPGGAAPTPGNEAFTRLLNAATEGLSPAAHRTITQAEGSGRSPNLGMREHQMDAGTGSIDRDFAVLLVPHHQISIDLARAELQYGRDKGMLEAASQVILDQQQEINQVQAWLAQPPK